MRMVATDQAPPARAFTVDGPFVVMGRPEELGEPGSPDHEQRTAALKHELLELGPWRKGPFRVCGVELHAHWNADVRLSRMLDHPRCAGLLPGTEVLDIGCNNGYYLFRLRAAGARSVLGLDPVQRFEQQFRFLETMVDTQGIRFERAGFAALRGMRATFDVVMLMGVIYHHRSPVEILEAARTALRPRGTLLLETMALPEEVAPDLPLVLVPRSRYLGMKGVWAVPNRTGLEQWLHRAGFRDIEMSREYSGFEDQARTPFADLPLPREFLDPTRPGWTTEGLPSPVRLHAWARR